jgi:hypothetical protein
MVMADERLSAVIQVPQFAVPALLGKKGSKVKDVESTSGASINIVHPKQKDLWAQVTISGTQAAISTASLLIKMAVLHARAADKSPEPWPYPQDKMAEAKLNMFTFHSETRAAAFSSKHPHNDL